MKRLTRLHLLGHSLEKDPSLNKKIGLLLDTWSNLADRLEQEIAGSGMVIGDVRFAVSWEISLTFNNRQQPYLRCIVASAHHDPCREIITVDYGAQRAFAITAEGFTVHSLDQVEAEKAVLWEIMEALFPEYQADIPAKVA